MSPKDTGAKVVDRRRNWEARVEMTVFKRPSAELSAYDKLVYAILCGHANRDGNAMLYVRTIAEEASCSDRQARRALSTLEARHLLVRRPQITAGQGQTFNIYEVYGFDEYSFDGNPSEGNGTEPPCTSDTTPLTDSHTPVCQPVTHPLPVSQAPNDSQAGPNNVFEQPLFNSSKKEHIPPAPQGGTERTERKPFFLSPEVNWYLPTNGKVKNAFGNSWGGFGIGINPEAFGWDEPDIELGGIALSPFFGYYNSEKRGNDVHIIPIGLEALWDLSDDKNFRPYVGLGLSISAVKFEDRDAGVKTGWKAAPGGRILLGADINKWLNLQASYSLMSDVAGYNFSGFSIGAGITFYF